MGVSPLTLSIKSPRYRNKKDWLSQKVQGKERFFQDSSRCWKLPRTALNKHSTIPLTGVLDWIRKETASWAPTLSFFLTMDVLWPTASMSCSCDSSTHDRLYLLELCTKINISSSCFWQVFCLTNQKNRQYREKGCVIVFRFGSQFEEPQSAMVLRTTAGLWMKHNWLVLSTVSKQGGNRKWSCLTLWPASLQWSTSSREAPLLKGSTTIPNNMAYWWPCVQTHEPVGDTSDSNCNSWSPVESAFEWSTWDIPALVCRACLSELLFSVCGICSLPLGGSPQESKLLEPEAKLPVYTKP